MRGCATTNAAFAWMQTACAGGISRRTTFLTIIYVNNPFPSGQGGATIPGFNGLNHGRAQLISLGDTKTFGTATVNEAHFSFMRSS